MQSDKASAASRGGWVRRFLFALPSSAALFFTFFFFGPVETVMANSASFQFGALSAVAPIMGLFALLCTAAAAALIALCRGRLYGALQAVCLGLALCLYVQGAFLNGGIPTLSGDDADWSAWTARMIANGAVWLALLIAPFALLRFREIWRYAAVVLPVTLFAMQLAGLAGTMATHPVDRNIQTGFLTSDGLCDYSGKGDVLVFMLDRLDYCFIEAVEEKQPGFFDRLDGFTCYDNAISQFAHTRPGMNFMLTGYDATLFRESADDFFFHSWDDGERHILKDMKAAGFDIRLYGDIRSLLGRNYESFTPWISNIDTSRGSISAPLMVKRMAIMNAYRDFPTAVKQYFFCTTEDCNRVFRRGVGYDPDETVYDARMSGMTADGGARCFRFYEFNGSHEPYRLRSDGSKSPFRTDATSQTMGCFEILLRTFDRLKQSGAYRDTAIIITADHGYMHGDYSPLEQPARIGLFYKPAGAEGAPLARSYAPVSLRNVPATIAKAAGLDYAAYGTPLDETPDDTGIVRDYCRTIAVAGDRWEDARALYYDVLYDAADPDSWILRHTEDIEYPLGF